MNRTILAQKRETRKGLLYDILESLRESDAKQEMATDIRSGPVADAGCWTEDFAKTEFGWKTVTPYEVVHENHGMDEETTRSDVYKTKTWNGQGLA